MNTNKIAISAFNNLYEGKMDVLTNEFSGGSIKTFKELVEGYVQNVDLMLMFYQFCKNKINPTTLFFDPKVDFTQKEKVISKETLKEICDDYKYPYDMLVHVEYMDEGAFNFLMFMLNKYQQSELNELVAQYSLNEYKSLCHFLNSKQVSAATVIDFIEYLKRVTCEVEAVPTLAEGKFNIPAEILDSYKEYDYENYCFLVNVLNHFDITFIDDVVGVFTVNAYNTFDDFSESGELDESTLDALVAYLAEFIEANCDEEE